LNRIWSIIFLLSIHFLVCSLMFFDG
jgi:hypothetical protein